MNNLWQYPALVEPMGIDDIVQNIANLFVTWNPKTNVPLFDVSREQWRYPFYFEVSWKIIEDLAAAIKMGWSPHYSDKIFDRLRTQYLYPYLSLYLGPITDFAVIPNILGTTELRALASSKELKALISALELIAKTSTKQVS